MEDTIDQLLRFDHSPYKTVSRVFGDDGLLAIVVDGEDRFHVVAMREDKNGYLASAYFPKNEFGNYWDVSGEEAIVDYLCTTYGWRKAEFINT